MQSEKGVNRRGKHQKHVIYLPVIESSDPQRNTIWDN